MIKALFVLSTLGVGFVGGQYVDRHFMSDNTISTALPLGIIRAGDPLPRWAAKEIYGNITAGMDLIGYLQPNGAVWIEPLNKLSLRECGDYLDPIDPTPGNTFIQCPFEIIMKGKDSYIEGFNVSTSYWSDDFAHLKGSSYQ